MTMGEWIALATGDRGYRAVPDGGTGPGVLLLHAWWGLDGTIRDAADRLADAGFTVVAPDLYQGVVVDTVEDAEREVDRVAFMERMPQVQAGIEALREAVGPDARALGVMGFSMGAFFALEAAAQEPALRAVVLCYGTGRQLDWSSSEASFLGHYAQDDPFEAVDDVRALADGVRAAGRPFELHVYPGTGHWFMEPDRHAFVPDAAALAWERTIDFLRRTLAGVA
jgi:carboxymethylenebutenolidase